MRKPACHDAPGTSWLILLGARSYAVNGRLRSPSPALTPAELSGEFARLYSVQLYPRCSGEWLKAVRNQERDGA